MRKKVVSILLAVTIPTIPLTGCGAPTEAPINNAKGEAKAAEDTKSNSSGLSTATVLDISQPPVTGIGTQITISIKVGRNYTAGYIVKNTTSPYIMVQSAGVGTTGEVTRLTAITQAPATADPAKEQVWLMENMITQGVDTVATHRADFDGIMTGVGKARDAGTLILTIGTPAAEDTFLRTGVGYYEPGYTMVRMAAGKLGGREKFVILEGPAGASNATKRLNGINTGLFEYGGIEIVAS